MKIVEMAVSKLKPYKRNNRKHPQAQIDKLAKQIAAHGWDVPIVVDKENVIIKGHGRLKAAKQLGLNVVPVVVRDDLTPEQCNAARIADNKLSELAEIDMEALQLELDALKAIDFDIDLTAFDSWNPFAVDDDQATNSDDAPKGKMSDEFGIPPFSVLNAREGWWQERKRQWLAMGIKSELGRGENVLDMSATMAGITDERERERWNEARRQRNTRREQDAARQEI